MNTVRTLRIGSPGLIAVSGSSHPVSVNRLVYRRGIRMFV